MNANELTEIIEHLENAKYIGASKAATMLRQQQSEIEALKQIIDANNLNQNIGQFVKPTNEPVAWMDDLSFFTEQPDDMDGVTPLYTHPIKELTDEEIEQISDDHIDWVYETGDIDFARAILRKAQEK